MREKLGICQWFHYEDHAAVERAVRLMQDLGVKHLRTGISWADYVRPRGKAWYDWQMRALSDFDVLLSIWHTPPSLSEGGTCASPPRRLRDFADFLDLVITDYGQHFGHLELWNEPNNRLKWDFERHDPKWAKFGQMIVAAAYWAQQRGKPTVLGGMIPVDHHWLALMKSYGVLPHIDVVAIHGFPEMWWAEAPCWDWPDHWHGWPQKVSYIAEHCHLPIWITETGLATWDLAQQREARHDLQVRMLDEASQAPVERVYWYCLEDLDPQRAAIEGFHIDENEYHLGLVRWDGSKKEAYHRLQDLLREPPSQ